MAADAHDGALHAVASALLHDGKYVEAWEHASPLFDESPPRWETKALAARIMLEWSKADGDEERLHSSVEAFNEALRLLRAEAADAARTAELVELENDRGVALYELHSLDEARRAFERTLELDSEHGRALSNMGLVNWAEGHERIALSNFDKAIACGGNLQHAHNNRGALLVQLGQEQKALTDFHAALALNPSYEAARRNRDGALAALEQPVPLQPADDEPF